MICSVAPAQVSCRSENDANDINQFLTMPEKTNKNNLVEGNNGICFLTYNSYLV